MSYNADTNALTATTFIGNLTGIAASATQLQTSRTFTITGVVDAPEVSFDGTGNVELVTTLDDTSITTTKIAPNAVTTAKINFTTALVPIGGIIMWTGTEIPTGYQLCNGSNGTPDLRNKFVVGASNVSKIGTTSQAGSSPYNPGDVGGNANATLVSHNHSGSAVAVGNHAHGGAAQIGPVITTGSQTNKGNIRYVNLNSGNTGDGGSHGHGLSIDYAGSSGTNANLPPYYALAFIMRTS